MSNNAMSKVTSPTKWNRKLDYISGWKSCGYNSNVNSISFSSGKTSRSSGAHLMSIKCETSLQITIMAQMQMLPKLYAFLLPQLHGTTHISTTFIEMVCPHEWSAPHPRWPDITLVLNHNMSFERYKKRKSTRWFAMLNLMRLCRFCIIPFSVLNKYQYQQRQSLTEWATIM